MIPSVLNNFLRNPFLLILFQHLPTKSPFVLFASMFFFLLSNLPKKSILFPFVLNQFLLLSIPSQKLNLHAFCSHQILSFIFTFSFIYLFIYFIIVIFQILYVFAFTIQSQLPSYKDHLNHFCSQIFLQSPSSPHLPQCPTKSVSIPFLLSISLLLSINYNKSSFSSLFPQYVLSFTVYLSFCQYLLSLILYLISQFYPFYFQCILTKSNLIPFVLNIFLLL